MTKKKFKIKPKTWPKEYTFEEFKSLNSSINENVLISKKITKSLEFRSI